MRISIVCLSLFGVLSAASPARAQTFQTYGDALLETAAAYLFLGTIIDQGGLTAEEVTFLEATRDHLAMSWVAGVEGNVAAQTHHGLHALVGSHGVPPVTAGLLTSSFIDINAVYAAYISGDGIFGNIGGSNQYAWLALWATYYALLDASAMPQ